MSVTLSINGKREDIEAGITLSQVLEAARIRPTVAVVFQNKERVAREELDTRVTAEDDLIEVILQFAGGSNV